jgi:hypothetical protein
LLPRPAENARGKTEAENRRIIEFPFAVVLDLRAGAIPEAHATAGPALKDSFERRAFCSPALLQ